MQIEEPAVFESISIFAAQVLPEGRLMTPPPFCLRYVRAAWNMPVSLHGVGAVFTLQLAPAAAISIVVPAFGGVKVELHD